MTNEANLADNRPERLRHYVFATYDRELVCAQIYDALGLPPTPKEDGPGVTEQFGFYSTMMRVGTTMLEIVQPMKPKGPLYGWLQDRGGDGGYMVVMQTYNAAALKARASAEALELTRDMLFKGQHMIQFDYRHFATHFELYQYSPEDNWWGDPLNRPYGDSTEAADVVGCDVAVDNPEAIAAQTARLFQGARAGTSVRFIDRTVNFVPAEDRHRGLVALDLQSRDPRRAGHSLQIGGVAFRFV